MEICQLKPFSTAGAIRINAIERPTHMTKASRPADVCSDAKATPAASKKQKFTVRQGQGNPFHKSHRHNYLCFAGAVLHHTENESGDKVTRRCIVC